MYWFVVFAHLGWSYYQGYRERERQTAALQKELVEARLEALRMQLNPHFLFNTLHAVSSLIHDDPDAADRIIARLSELLRLSLDQSKPQEVSLQEELAFLDRYLDIELTRFADRLKVQKQIEPGVQDALVPYLLLQPLVENAIRHGIEPREDAGHLEIRAQRNNGKLQLSVIDDGAGLSGSAATQPREGIGLSNTRSRLRHLYGENFRFELVEVSGGGLAAQIEIPYHTTSANGQ
jgi:sensor histidine kinase YesM